MGSGEKMKKAVLITGACINTGVAIVEKFLAEGLPVIFTGRREETVKDAEARYRAKFPTADVMGVAIDSHDDAGAVNEAGVTRLFEMLDEKEILIDTLVLNAADQGLGMTVLESPLSDFTRVMDTNVTWNLALCVAAARRMRDKKTGGSITFINSNTAYRAIPDRVAYVASKGAQLGLVRALALDLGKYGIRVNAVLPGMIRTDRWEKNPDFYKSVPSRFTPLGDVADGCDVADAVWYFAAHARNTTGAELVLDGGNTVQLYPVIPS